MTSQQNAVVQRTFKVPSRQGERDSGSPSGDSSILCYIKTLTSHQTNAKQQWMDRYLQKAKHAQQTEDVKSLKPPRYFATKNERQKASVSTFKAPATSLWKGTKPKGQQKLPESSSVALDERRAQGKLTDLRKNNRLRSKRLYEGNQSNRQPKKSKQAPTKQQIAASGALDRFRLNSTWFQDKSQTSASGEVSSSKMLQNATIPVTGSIPLPQAPSQAKSGLGAISAEVEEGRDAEVTRSVQPLQAKESTTRPVVAAVQDVWANSNQHASFLSPEEMQPETLDFQQEDFVPTYDPLMESIYF
ncbi:hypothetical protein PC128_g7557 [Phytophthora cactorum]|nr:hypothetical protein PC128_g7557 [Phytophthora cactorum]